MINHFSLFRQIHSDQTPPRYVMLTHHFNGSSLSALTEQFHYIVQIIVKWDKNNSILWVFAHIFFSLHPIKQRVDIQGFNMTLA